MCEVRVIHIAHKGRRLALLTLQDVTELFHARTVLDNSEYAALLIDGRGCILTFNKPATVLFGDLEVGMDAEPSVADRARRAAVVGARTCPAAASCTWRSARGCSR